MFEKARIEMEEAEKTIKKLIDENVKMSAFLSRANSTIEFLKRQLAGKEEAIINLQNQLLLTHEDLELSSCKISQAQTELLANSLAARVAITLN